MKQSVTDSTLGELRFNKKRECYEGAITTAEGALAFTLAVDGEPLAAALTNARSAVRDLDALVVRARDAVVAKMLPLKNASWLVEGEEMLTEDQFRKRVSLKSLEALGSGMLTLCFGDDEMFGGHALLLTVGADGRLWEPELFG